MISSVTEEMAWRDAEFIVEVSFAEVTTKDNCRQDTPQTNLRDKLGEGWSSSVERPSPR